MKTIDVVIVTKADHIYTLRIAVQKLQQFLRPRHFIIVTNRAYFNKIGNVVDNLQLIDEEKVIPNLSIDELKKLNLHGFPKRAGWYFQQLLKLGISFFEEITENYLVWDADTILLKPLEFMNKEGKAIFTISDEYHQPYFDNYRKLLGEDANREYSFISQHMIFNKKLVKEMLTKIDRQLPGNDIWAMKIMKNLEGNKGPLFSEYEFYGHYLKNNHPDKFIIRKIPWTRYGSYLTRKKPKESDLKKLSKKYYFAAFEVYNSKFNVFKHYIKKKIKFYS